MKKCLGEEILWEYLDGELEASTLVEVETHLEKCIGCREELEQIKAFDSDLSFVVQTQPSMRFAKNVMDIIEIELSPSEYKPILQKFWRRIIVAGFAISFITAIFVAFAFPVTGKSPLEPELAVIGKFLVDVITMLQSPYIVNTVTVVIAFWLLFLADKFFITYTKK